MREASPLFQFEDEETEAQRVKVICLTSHSLQVAESRPELRKLDLRRIPRHLLVRKGMLVSERGKLVSGAHQKAGKTKVVELLFWH